MKLNIRTEGRAWQIEEKVFDGLSRPMRIIHKKMRNLLLPPVEIWRRYILIGTQVRASLTFWRELQNSLPNLYHPCLEIQGLKNYTPIPWWEHVGLYVVVPDTFVSKGDFPPCSLIFNDRTLTKFDRNRRKGMEVNRQAKVMSDSCELLDALGYMIRDTPALGGEMVWGNCAFLDALEACGKVIEAHLNAIQRKSKLYVE